jgi:CheY-like chemotaxis protein/anti-sigma regulatory factor (Ser/Thr protein kinase)
VQAAQVGLGFRYAKSSVVVNSDSQLLARILRNLLTNAVRYTKEGRILLGCRRRANGLDIEVADTGVGIPEEQLDIIFDEFQRLEGNQRGNSPGLGLGLAIVEKLARVLGCTVSVRSLPSRGSVFTIKVPYGRAVQRESEFSAPLPVPESFHGRRVLVVDNEAAICKGMETLLGSWGCSVRSALDPDALAELYASDEPRPDIAIVDYQLDNGLTGFDAVERIDRLFGEPFPVVMITANYTKALREEITDSGYYLMNKPVKPHKLRLLMARLLQA